MTDESALHRDVDRAARAGRLLSDDVLGGAFAALEADYIAAWKETPARDTDARERLWQAVQIVGKVRSHLVSIVSGGKLAQRELDNIAKLGERKKILGVI